MPEKEHAFSDLERQLHYREKAIERSVRRGGPRAGLGLNEQCASCGRRYRVVGLIRDSFHCPYCGR